MASIVEFVRNHTIRSYCKYDRASSLVIRLKSKQRHGPGRRFILPTIHGLDRHSNVCNIIWWATSISILLYDETVGRRTLHRMRHEGASIFGIEPTCNISSESWGNISSPSPYPITELDLASYFEPMASFIVISSSVLDIFYLWSNLANVFELRENCELYFDMICKWTYQHQASWNYHGFSLVQSECWKGEPILSEYAPQHSASLIVSAREQYYGWKWALYYLSRRSLIRYEL